MKIKLDLKSRNETLSTIIAWKSVGSVYIKILFLYYIMLVQICTVNKNGNNIK